MRTGGRLLGLAGMLLVATAWLTAGRCRRRLRQSRRAPGASHARPDVARTCGTGQRGAGPGRRLRRFGRLPRLPRGRLREMEGVAAHPDDPAGRRGHRARRLQRPGHALRARSRVHLRPQGRPADRHRPGRQPAGRDLPGGLHARVEAAAGLPVHASRRADVRAAGVLARRERAVARLEGDHADPRRRPRHEADLERQLLQLPRHQPRSRLRAGARRLPHALDRTGHRLRGLPRPGP